MDFEQSKPNFQNWTFAKSDTKQPAISDFQKFNAGPRQVRVKFTFITVGDIDTKSQRFIAEVLIQAKWTEPALRGIHEADDINNFPDVWDPKLRIRNLEEVKSGRDTIWHTVKLGDGDPVVIYKHHLKGAFFEKMELRDFPRDVQDITITLCSALSKSEIDFISDPDELSSVDPSTFQDKQEWQMFQHVEVVKDHLVDLDEEYEEEEDGNNVVKVPLISASCRVVRKGNFFFWNAILIMMCISVLSFTGFAINYQMLKFRLGVSLTLLLTSVAFKLSVNSHLPMISYLTLLDIYLIISMMFLVFMSILFAILSLFSDDHRLAVLLDRICFCTLIFFQILFHIGYASLFFYRTGRNIRKMQKLDAKYKMESEMRVRRPTRGPNDAPKSYAIDLDKNAEQDRDMSYIDGSEV